MAFTSDERYRILFYLGFSIFEDDGPAMRSINSLDSREAGVRPLLMPILDNIQRLQDELMATLPLLKSIETDGVKLRATTVTIPGIQELGKIYIAQLSRLTKIQPCPHGHIFSSAIPSSGFYSGDPSEARIDPQEGTFTRQGGGRGEW